MKKLTLLLLIVFNLLSYSSYSQTVYITNTGEKYHRGDCRYLSHSKIATELKEAIGGGYEPCKICKPPVNVSEKKNNDTETKSKPSQTEKSSSSVQCSGTTKAGSRCKRMTKSSNGKCYQHGG